MSPETVVRLMRDKDVPDLVEQATKSYSRIEGLEKELDQERAQFARHLVALRRKGLSLGLIAKLTDLSASRVHQLTRDLFDQKPAKRKRK